MDICSRIGSNAAKWLISCEAATEDDDGALHIEADQEHQEVR